MPKPKDKIEGKLNEVIYDLTELDADINAFELFIANADIIIGIRKALRILEEVERKIEAIK